MQLSRGYVRDCQLRLNLRCDNRDVAPSINRKKNSTSSGRRRSKPDVTEVTSGIANLD